MSPFFILIAIALLSYAPLQISGDSHDEALYHSLPSDLATPDDSKASPRLPLSPPVRRTRQASWEGADSCSHAFHSYLCRRKGKTQSPLRVEERPAAESRSAVVKARPSTYAPVSPKPTPAPSTRPPLPAPVDPFLEGSLSSPLGRRVPPDPAQVKPTTKGTLCSGPLLSSLCPTQKPLLRESESAEPTFISRTLTKPNSVQRVPTAFPKPSIPDPAPTREIPNRKIGSPREAVPSATDLRPLNKDMCSHPFHSFLCAPRGTRRRGGFGSTKRPTPPARPIVRDPDNFLSGDASNPFGQALDPAFVTTTTTTTNRPTTTTRRPTTTTKRPSTITFATTTTTPYRPTTTPYRPTPTTYRPTTTTYRPTTTTKRTTTTTRRPSTTTIATTTTRKPTTAPRPTPTRIVPTRATARPTTTTPPPAPLVPQEARSPSNAVLLPLKPVASGARETEWVGDSCKHSFHSYLCSPTKSRKNRIRLGGPEESRQRPQAIPPPTEKATSRPATTAAPDPRPAPFAFGQILLPASITTTVGPCVVGDPRPECDPSLRADASSQNQFGVKITTPPANTPPPPPRPLPPATPPPPTPPRPRPTPFPAPTTKTPARPPPFPTPTRGNALPPVPAEFVRGPAATDLVESNALPSNSCAHAFHSHLCTSPSRGRSRRKRIFGK